ncbi:zf-TFIIB domain-containing protein [Halosimplex pelagicum]|uniref:Zf-TFIIB domain-containing protein n=1 Tax=Halosimplex pelagicum TaxID=869886 RepID=A0A7D5PCN3_9EURY|nr:zf-TFIIB domain-containing protein [Halosimplex pelagicum]
MRGTYRFCPHCGTRLVARSSRTGVPSYECPDCSGGRR